MRFDVKDEFTTYLELLIKDVPLYVYVVFLIVFSVGFILLMVFKREKSVKSIATLLFVEYLSLLFCSTVLFRAANDVRSYELTPFWSYDRPDLLIENIMNAVVFVPIGFLLGCLLRNITWWMVLSVGISISVSIEISQFYLKCGFSELDDVIHNTMGCIIGYWIISLIRYTYEKVSERRMAVL